MHSTIIEELPDDPALRDSYMMPSPKEPSPKPSDSSLNTNSATLLPTPEKTHVVDVTSAMPPSPGGRTSGDAWDTDLEAIMPTESGNRRAGRSDSAMWPPRKEWMRKAKEAKRERQTCTCMASLSRRTRIAVKIAIGLLIVGIAVGVGFGVSKPLGAPIWGDNKR